MRSWISLFSRGCVLMFIMCTMGSQRVPAAPAVPSNGESASARYMTEVRLRRLHLARPDLIPYPLETEVYC
jgi:hypothetical protein